MDQFSHLGSKTLLGHMEFWVPGMSAHDAFDLVNREKRKEFEIFLHISICHFEEILKEGKKKR